MSQLLETINSPQDLKRLTIPQLAQLAKEIREFIISTVCRTGGHLAPSLGVVELTLALHYIFDAPRDKIVWDVGHQAYVHKIITGRRHLFGTLRQMGGISGFPRPAESPYDTFGTGHASTSISAALGMACARDLRGENYSVVAVIGDGAMTGGLAFEGLNNAGALKKDLIVILNDNRMSISRNVGALSHYLTTVITAPIYNKLKNDIWELTGKLPHFGRRIRQTVSRIDQGLKAILVPGLLFERLGFRYFGPIAGHNLSRLIMVLREVKKLKGPILVHVTTVKGKGYKFAEKDASKFHGLSSFDKETGTVHKKLNVPTYTEVFGKTLVEIAEKDPKIIGITAAMPDGTGLKFLAQAFPDRFFDVGIAEQHAVTFAAGLAISGFKPVVAIYSTFLQRAYDQIIHDVALQNLPVVFAMDRAGLVGEDGPTHHGSFDLSYLRNIPNMVIMAPKDEAELRDMLWTAVNYQKGPIAFRYPRGYGIGAPLGKRFKSLEIGKSETLKKGTDVALLAVGAMVNHCLQAGEILEKHGISAEVHNMRFIKPIDEGKLDKIAHKFPIIFTIEDNAIKGGFGSAVAEYYLDNGYTNVQVIRLGLPDEFIEHGEKGLLYQKLGLDAEGIARRVIATLKDKSKKLNKWVGSRAS